MNYSDLVADSPRDELYGVYVGIVADIEDPENQARVKVKFPWRDAEDKSTWARLATAMTGKDMGTYFLPETGDEVLVAFCEGDIHEPFIIGSLWNGKQKPPQKNKKKNPIRQIKSRAGHKLTFDDEKGKGKVEIETNKEQTVVVDDKNEKIHLEDKHGNKITMNKEGITIESPKNVSIEGKSIELTADKDVSVSAQKVTSSAKAKTKISSKGQLQLKSSGKASLQASGMLNIKTSGMLQMKGSMIMLN